MEKNNKHVRSIDYNLKEIYNYYKKITERPVNYITFSAVIKSFNKKFAEELYNGSYINMPSKLGDMYIEKYKPVYKFDKDGVLTNAGQNCMIDYKATNELWKKHPELAHKQRVFYTNEHSDGFKFKIKWLTGTIRNKIVYIFVPAKSLKRNLAKYTRNNPNKDYHGK